MSPPINEEGGGRLFFFTGVNGVRWKSPVTPGDQLVMEMSLVNFDERLGFATMTGKAYVGGKVISITVEYLSNLRSQKLFDSCVTVTFNIYVYIYTKYQSVIYLFGVVRLSFSAIFRLLYKWRNSLLP